MGIWVAHTCWLLYLPSPAILQVTRLCLSEGQLLVPEWHPEPQTRRQYSYLLEIPHVFA